jgi:hypothetical protein
MWTPFALARVRASARADQFALELTRHSQHRVGPLLAPRKPKFELTTTGAGGLIRQAPEGKQDPRQKKERGKGQQNKNQRTGLLAGPVRKIPFEAVPIPAPPRRIWRGMMKT